VVAEGGARALGVLRALPGGGDEDVAGLDVPVDQPGPVGGVQRVPDLPHQRQRPAHREVPALLEQHALQVAADDVAHRDEQLPVGLAGLEYGDDVRVVQRRGQPGLPDEPLPELLVVRQLRGEQLQGDLAPQPHVLGAVDHRHATAPDQGLDPVAGDLGTWLLLGHVAPWPPVTR
jgi:hypothetical protein